MQCGAMQCGAMQCDAMRRDAMRRDAMRCGAMRCGAMRGPDRSSFGPSPSLVYARFSFKFGSELGVQRRSDIRVFNLGPELQGAALKEGVQCVRTIGGAAKGCPQSRVGTRQEMRPGDTGFGWCS